MQKIKPNEIKTHPLFVDLFTIRQKLLNKIEAYQKVQKTSGKKVHKLPDKIEEKRYLIPDDLYCELEQLGGLIDEHIDVAITAYLFLTEEQRQNWMSQVFEQYD
jgi:hypothetical protein